MAHHSAEVRASLPLVELLGRVCNGRSVRGPVSIMIGRGAVGLADYQLSRRALQGLVRGGRQLRSRRRRQTVEVLLLLLLLVLLGGDCKLGLASSGWLLHTAVHGGVWQG